MKGMTSMKAVIMAGGQGTRLRSVSGDLPKPMVPVLGKPVLAYQIECLRKNESGDADSAGFIQRLESLDGR